MDLNNRLKPVRDPGKKTKNKLEPLVTKIKRQKPVSTTFSSSRNASDSLKARETEDCSH